MRQKLRTIVVDGMTYRWRFAPGYERTGDPADPYQSHDIFTAYLAEQRTGHVQIHFRTWEDVIVGGPLRTARPLNRTNPESSAVNLQYTDSRRRQRQHCPALAGQRWGAGCHPRSDGCGRKPGLHRQRQTGGRVAERYHSGVAGAVSGL
jgi:hypothetical protein